MGHMAYLCGGDPSVFYTTLISAVVIYEPAKVFFCRGVCVCVHHLFNDVK